MGNFAGGQNGHFFHILPDYIDKTKPPGFSKLPQFTFMEWVRSWITLRHLWASPNFVWIMIALVVYFLLPYDLSSSSAASLGPLSWAFFRERLPMWALITFGYNAFFHVVLYFLGWSDRPFIPDRPYRWDKIAHNLFWSVWAVLIWVGFENTFAYLWASGRLSFLSDKEAFTTPSGFLRFFLGAALIPVWRDFHFYFAHRLLHVRPIFQQVHSLHHRNTDIEPFSGLCMHPVEHLYYYACILPSIFFFASPFHFLWNGVHLLLSPGASHSGFEDHFQADGFHYMHHRYFECNYAGFTAGFLDVMFGTFMEKFKEDEGKVKPRDDAKSSIKGLPSMEFVFYLSVSAAFLGFWAYFAEGVAAHTGLVSPNVALAIAFLAGFGPVLLANGMTLVRDGPSALLMPFHKAPLTHFLLHLVVGNLFCALPVSAACYLSLLA